MREISASIHIDATIAGTFRLLNEALKQRVENGQAG